MKVPHNQVIIIDFCEMRIYEFKKLHCPGKEANVLIPQAISLSSNLTQVE